MGIRKRLKRNRVSPIEPPASDGGDIVAFVHDSGNFNNTNILGAGTSGHVRAISLSMRTGVITLRNGNTFSGNDKIIFKLRNQPGSGSRYKTNFIEFPGNGIAFDDGLATVFFNLQGFPNHEVGDIVIFYEID